MLDVKMSVKALSAATNLVLTQVVPLMITKDYSHKFHVLQPSSPLSMEKDHLNCYEFRRKARERFEG